VVSTSRLIGKDAASDDEDLGSVVGGTLRDGISRVTAAKVLEMFVTAREIVANAIDHRGGIEASASEARGRFVCVDGAVASTTRGRLYRAQKGGALVGCTSR
jgi:hypothetical protein